MKSASDVLKFFYHLKLALFYANNFTLQHPKTVFAALFKGYIAKIKWMHTNTITSIELCKNVPDVIQILKEKWNSEVFAEMAVMDKITLLNDEQMNQLELVVDEILKGETIEIEFVKK
jgi:hypothetical protein